MCCLYSILSDFLSANLKQRRHTLQIKLPRLTPELCHELPRVSTQSRAARGAYSQPITLSLHPHVLRLWHESPAPRFRPDPSRSERSSRPPKKGIRPKCCTPLCYAACTSFGPLCQFPDTAVVTFPCPVLPLWFSPAVNSSMFLEPAASHWQSSEMSALVRLLRRKAMVDVGYGLPCEMVFCT